MAAHALEKGGCEAEDASSPELSSQQQASSPQRQTRLPCAVSKLGDCSGIKLRRVVGSPRHELRCHSLVLTWLVYNCKPVAEPADSGLSKPVIHSNRRDDADSDGWWHGGQPGVALSHSHPDVRTN